MTRFAARSWRTHAQVEAECLTCHGAWTAYGKTAYTAARRHTEKTGHRVRVEVHHVVVYEPT